MKKRIILLGIFLIAFSFLLSGCDNKKDDKTINPNKLVISELEKTHITAELGERCDIPKLTATIGRTSLEVLVSVKDSSGNEVELQGRNTRFIASDINGYTILYTVQNGETVETRTVTVSVNDEKGPDISLPKTALSLNVKIDEEVEIPAATITDKSGVVSTTSVKVTFNGTAVTVNNNKFTADKYGNYNVLYEAEDGKGNKSSKEITISCSRMVLLEGFENDINVWSADAIFTTEHAVSGNCMKISTEGTEAFKAIALYPKYYDLSGFDKFQLTIYCSKDMNTKADGIYLLNTKYQLEEGENILTISKDDFQNQYPHSVIPCEKPNYNGYNYIWFQAVSSELGYFYIDNFVGIYENYETDTKPPVISFDKEVNGTTVYLKDGQTLNAPVGVAYDNSMDLMATPKYTAKDMSGKDITTLVKSGSYTVKEGNEYTLTYTVSDKAGNTGTKTIKIIVEAPPQSEKPTDYYPTNRQYDVLNDCENLEDIDSFLSKSLTEKFIISDTGHSIELTGNTAGYSAVFTMLLKNGKALSNTAWAKYETIKFSIFSYTGGIDFYVFNKVLGKINPGYNVFSISSEDLLKEINSREDCYKANGYFWLQLNGGRAQLYFDDIIGIYPEGYDRATDNVPDFEEVKYYEDGRTYDVLNTFENALDVDISLFASSTIKEDHARNGNAYNITAANADWSKLPIKMLKDGKPLTEEDFNKYDYFRISIYSDGTCTFGFLNKTYGIAQGENIITISKADLVEQINSYKDKTEKCYNFEEGWFWCQVYGKNVNLYLDELIAVYPQK